MTSARPRARRLAACVGTRGCRNPPREPRTSDTTHTSQPPGCRGQSNLHPRGARSQSGPGGKRHERRSIRDQPHATVRKRAGVVCCAIQEGRANDSPLVKPPPRTAWSTHRPPREAGGSGCRRGSDEHERRGMASRGTGEEHRAFARHSCRRGVGRRGVGHQPPINSVPVWLRSRRRLRRVSSRRRRPWEGARWPGPAACRGPGGWRA